MNPSTQTRLERLSLLVAELSKTNLNSGDAAVLLGCSNSGARKYLLELSEAGVVHSMSQPVQRGRHRTAYALNKDRLVVNDYLLTLSESKTAVDLPARPNNVGMRDPLINALFGPG